MAATVDRDRLVEVVEAAAEWAWIEIPLPVQHTCQRLVPPTQLDVLLPFAGRVVRWLTVNAQNLPRCLTDNAREIVEAAHVMRGRHANRADHVWLELVLVGGRRVSVDVSTPPGCEMYLVASDVTIAEARRRDLPAYFRRISICFGDGADSDVFLDGVEVDAPGYPWLPKSAIGDVVGALLRYARDGGTAVHDEHVDAMRRVIAPADLGVDDKKLSKWPRLYARALCNSLRDTLHGLFVASWANPADLHRRVAAMDETWTAVFGRSKIWTRAFTPLPELVVITTQLKPVTVDEASRAFLAALDALARVVKETDALAFEGMKFPPPAGRTPGQEWLVRMLWVRPDARRVACKLGKQLAERYPAKVAFVLECTADMVFHSRWGDADVKQRTVNEFTLLRGSCAAECADAERYDYERFFLAVQAYAETPSPQIGLFQRMLDAWGKIDARVVLPAPPPAEVASGDDVVVADESGPPKPTHARVKVFFDLRGGMGGLHVVDEAGDGQTDASWTTAGELADLKGNVWEVHRESMPRGAIVGGMHVFLESMALTATDQFKTVRAVWLLAKLPAGADATTWTRQTAPFVIAPLLERMATPASPALDAWATYMEDVRRAIHVLCCTVASELEFCAVACPAAFEVDALDTEMSSVSQWLVYFSEMPYVAHSYLAGMRKRYGTVFSLLHGVQHDAHATLTRVSVQFQSHELQVSGVTTDRAYGRALADAVWEWKQSAGGSETATALVPKAVLREGEFERIGKHKCLLSDAHISDDMPALGVLVRDEFPTGTVFAICRRDLVELTFHRDVAHHFELAYTKTLVALREAVRVGELDRTTTASNALHMDLSDGYVDDVPAAREKLRHPVVVRPGEWKPDTLAFLHGWVRQHLRRAVERSLAVLRVMPGRVEFLPSMRLVCSLCNVQFMTTVYLSNALENGAKRNSVFTVVALPVVDAAAGMCTVDLGAAVARWFGARVLANETADGSRTRVAPYTRASGKVYLCSERGQPVEVGRFASYKTGKRLIMDGLRVECDTRGYPSAFESLHRAHAAAHQKVTYDIMCRSTSVPSDESVRRVLRSLAAYKFHESFNGMPLYPELAERVEPDAYEACVVREYYENPYVHPRVVRVECTFSMRKFVTALYGRENAFLSAIQ